MFRMEEREINERMRRRHRERERRVLLETEL